jgi:prepilin-type processing-associated H-X9-DG protein
LLNPYIKNWQVYNCPSSAVKFAGGTSARMAYGYNYQSIGGLCASNCGETIYQNLLSVIEYPAGTMVFADSDSLKIRATSPDGKWPTLEELQTDDDGTCDFNSMKCIRVRHLDTVNVAFADGHAKSLPWQQLVTPAGLHYWTTTENPVPNVP